MSGIIGADNRFAKDFGYPDTTTQGTIVAIYDVRTPQAYLRTLK